MFTFRNTVTRPTDSDGMTNSEDHDQTAHTERSDLGLHCFAQTYLC